MLTRRKTELYLSPASLCALEQMGTPPAGQAADVMPCALAPHRSQELHLRPESHSYLPELGKSEMEFLESKRPRLELLPDPLLRPSPLLAAGQPGGSEDLSKVRPAQPGAPLRVWVLLRLGGEQGRG